MSWSLPLGGLLVASLVPGLGAQQRQAPVLGKTPNNAALGQPAEWDLAGTDMTYKSATDEVWLVDPYSGPPVINVFQATGLTGARRQIPITLPAELTGAPVLGIAEIPHGGLKDSIILLVDLKFGTQETPEPQLGIFGPTGMLLPGEVFVPITGLDPGVQLTAIDVNPVREQFVAYDARGHAMFVFDFTFSVLNGPLPLLGGGSFFAGDWSFGGNLRGAGTGIAYSGEDTVLAISSLKNFADAHWALEYDLARDGAYSGRAIDLGAARDLDDLNAWTMFQSMDLAAIGAENVLLTHNLDDDSVYAFGAQLEAHGAPVVLQGCAVTAEDLYTLSWTLASNAPATTAVFIFENGVQVASLPGDATSFTSPLPFLGKTHVEVATEAGGWPSGVRVLCEIENSSTPVFGPNPVTASNLGNELGRPVTGVAVTKTPATIDEIRAYVLGIVSNDLLVFDAQLAVVERLTLNPRVVGTGQGSTYNTPSIGVSLFRFEPEGVDHLAILDPDGPNNTGNPSAHFYPLAGDDRGTLTRSLDPIDLSPLGAARPTLLDWDWDGDTGFVASGFVPSTGSNVIVRIRLLGTRLVATQMADIPHRMLTPFSLRPLVGAGVSILPSGNLLVAGGDTFHDTYAEALLMTPFSDDPPAPPSFVGYAQGLITPGQFFSNTGAGVGPLEIFGLDTAYLPLPADPPPPEGMESVGVTLLPTSDMVVAYNAAQGIFVPIRLNLLVRSTNSVSHPDLAAEQLSDFASEVPGGGKIESGDLSPSFAARADVADYYYYLFNTSTTAAASLTLAVRLDGAEVAAAAERIVLPPGRYFRRALSGRAEDSISVEATNTGTTAAAVRLLVGASAVAPGGGPARILFKRGDCDLSAQVNLTDAIFGLDALFRGKPQSTCLDACDVDDDGQFNLTDMIVVLNHLFRGAPPPPAPGPDTCGEDPTTDDALEPCVYPAEACQ